LYDAKTPLAKVRDDAKRLSGPALAELVEFMNFNGTGQVHADLNRKLERLEQKKAGWRMVNDRAAWRPEWAQKDRVAGKVQRQGLEREITATVHAGIDIWERNAADGKVLGDYFDGYQISAIRNWVNR